ncbi:MAG: hypothetical protein AAF327_22015 [Cyanobacteria bacterium P01_A01_bin.37]
MYATLCGQKMSEKEVRTKYSYHFEGCKEFARIIQYNIALAEKEENLSPYAWGLKTGYKQVAFNGQLANLEIENPKSPHFAHVTAATLWRIGQNGILKKEDGSGTYSFEELLQIVFGFKYTPELITSIDEMVFAHQPAPSATAQVTPYAEGVAILKEAMGDRPSSDFPQLPNLEAWLKGEKLIQHDITLAMAFLGLTDKIGELYQIYGHELHVPAPPKQKPHQSSNGKASNGNGNKGKTSQRQ